MPYNSMASNQPTPRFQRLRIHYTNDMHEKYDAMGKVVEAYHELSDKAQQEGVPYLNLDAGDWNISKEPEQMDLNVRLLNLMGLHAATLVNHDFDSGTKVLAEALKKAR